MKKIFLSVALISMSVGLSTSLVSCKDYDDDITEINGNTSDLSNQITALKEQLQQQTTSLNTAAQDAKKAADQAAAAAQTAQNAGDAAMAKAQAAQSAAEQAKSDALAAVNTEAQKLTQQISALETTVSSASTNVADVKTQVEGIITANADLQGKVSAIDAKLANMDLGKITSDLADVVAKAGATETEVADLKAKYAEVAPAIQTLNQFKSAAELQISALEAFKTSTATDVSGLQSKISDAEGKLNTILQTTLPGLDSRVAALEGMNLSEVKTNVGILTTELGEVKTELGKVSGNITSAVDGAVNTLVEILSSRLSSVTFVPSNYVNGIPAIDFSYMEYTPMIQNVGADKKPYGNWIVNEDPKAKSVTVSSTGIKAVYRLNPSTVQLEDIVVDGLEFVDGVATSRAAEPTSLISVAENGASINEDGELVLNVVKNGTDLFNKGLADNQINIVALKIPVAEKHLFEGETEANVFSEYVRLAELKVTPQIGAINPEKPVQFSDSSKVATAAVVKVPYNKATDLTEMIGALLYNGSELFASLKTPEALADYNLTLKFHMTGSTEKTPVPYTVDGVDQQIFGKVEGNTFTPVVPNKYTLNDIPGMTPLVTVTLMNGNNVVDQDYVKLQLSAENDYEFTFDYTSDLFCDDLNVFESVNNNKTTYLFTWDKFKTDVLAKCGNAELGYITQDEFIKYFVTDGTTTITYNYAKDAEESGITLDFDKNNKNNVISWTVSAEQVGEVKTSTTVGATIEFANKDRGTITVKLSLAVTYAASQVPALGVADNLIWNNGTMLIYPSNPASGDKTARYYTNILQGRSNPYVQNLLDCASYYMFLVDPKMPELDADGKEVVGADKNPVYVANPASLVFPTAFKDEYSITAANQKNLTANGIYFSINNDADGKRMVEDEMTLSMNWNAYLNGEVVGNNVLVGTSSFKIVKPLSLSTVNSEDALVDNSEPESISLDGFYTITDAYGNVVFNKEDGKNQNLYDFYGITSVTFGPDADITIADNAAGTENVRKPSALSMAISVSANGTLTYQNTGAVLVDNAYIIVPVTIQHAWGTLKGNIAVPLEKKL